VTNWQHTQRPYVSPVLDRIAEQVHGELSAVWPRGLTVGELAKLIPDASYSTIRHVLHGGSFRYGRAPFARDGRRGFAVIWTCSLATFDGGQDHTPERKI
jgi:hypothetical protein